MAIYSTLSGASRIVRISTDEETGVWYQAVSSCLDLGLLERKNYSVAPASIFSCDHSACAWCLGSRELRNHTRRRYADRTWP